MALLSPGAVGVCQGWGGEVVSPHKIITLAHNTEIFVCMKIIHEWIVLVEKHRGKRVYVSQRKQLGGERWVAAGGCRYEYIKSVRLATIKERKLLLGEEEPETDPKEPLPKYWIVNVEKDEDYQVVYDYLKMKYPDKCLAVPGKNMFKYTGEEVGRGMVGERRIHKANFIISFFGNPPLLTIDQF